MRWSKRVGRKRTQSAGMVPYGNGKSALYARRFYVQRPMLFISWLPSGSLSTTIWR